MDDPLVIARCRAGDWEAFRHLVERYQAQAIGHALALLGNREDALDAVQEAFLAAYRALDRFDLERRFYPWFYTILRHCCFKLAGRERKRETASLEETEILATTSGLPPEELLALEQALRALSAQEREIIYVAASGRTLLRRTGGKAGIDMRSKTRLFVILWLAGMAGVGSFLLVDLAALIAHLPLPAGTAPLQMTPAMKLLSLLQPAVLLTLAVFIGVMLAAKVGLSSPLAEAAASGGKMLAALKPQIVPGLLGGLSGSVAIVFIGWLTKPFLPPEVVTRSAAFAKFFPLPTRLFYGGLTEELLLRWGLMTLLVWALWRLLQKGQGQPKPAYVLSAILLSSLVFGLGHLPMAFLLFPQATTALICYVIVANSFFGLLAGYLYWRKGLESAMIAHMLAHVVMFTASYLDSATP